MKQITQYRCLPRIGESREVFTCENEKIKLYPTQCCALGHLSTNDHTSSNMINGVLEILKKQSLDPKFYQGDMRLGGERAVFVITTPDEGELEGVLEECGFKMIYEFHRRAYAPEDEMLKMWIYSW